MSIKTGSLAVGAISLIVAGTIVVTPHTSTTANEPANPSPAPSSSQSSSQDNFEPSPAQASGDEDNDEESEEVTDVSGATDSPQDSPPPTGEASHTPGEPTSTLEVSDTAASRPSPNENPPATDPLAKPEATMPISLAQTPGSVAVAPIISGSASPNTVVSILVGAQAVTTSSSTSGAWSYDLSALNLAAGSVHLSISQEGSGETVSDSFTLQIPGARVYASAANPNSQPGVRVPFTVEFSGIPGATVCPRVQETLWSPVTLDSSGIAETPLFYAWPFNSVSFSYCEGSRQGALTSIGAP